MHAGLDTQLNTCVCTSVCPGSYAFHCVPWLTFTSKHSPHPAPFSYLKAHQVVPEKGISGPDLAPLHSSQYQYTYHAPECSPLPFSQTHLVSL